MIVSSNCAIWLRRANRLALTTTQKGRHQAPFFFTLLIERAAFCRRINEVRSLLPALKCGEIERFRPLSFTVCCCNDGSPCPTAADRPSALGQTLSWFLLGRRRQRYA